VNPDAEIVVNGETVGYGARGMDAALLAMRVGRISISDLRSLARALGDDPAALDILGAIEAAENLRAAHAWECGCDRPGSPICEWDYGGALLASFEFDEEVIEWP
jgi:hypothetical protein